MDESWHPLGPGLGESVVSEVVDGALDRGLDERQGNEGDDSEQGFCIKDSEEKSVEKLDDDY